jgi:FSR family fosmidomycin resistance protein-like MFS transporter
LGNWLELARNWPEPACNYPITNPGEKMSLKLKIESIPRREDVSDRVMVVSLAARFMDEILGGLPTVLMPTIRATLRLSYVQVSLLSLVLNYVAAVVEPVAGLLIDIWKRPLLMAGGAAVIGLATAVMGAAPTFGILALGFAIYGIGSGPLAHTADVVMVEAYPDAPSRIYARSTMIDTLGALLAPLLVAITIWLNLSWRWLMIGLGLSGLIYALLILRTRFPRPLNGDDEEELTIRQAMKKNLKAVLSNRNARLWLLFLFVHEVSEAPFQFNAIWLREQVGMSQALVGIYVAVEMAVGIISLFLLDRWLARSSQRRIIQTASLGVIVLYPLWLFLPGIWTRFVLAVPLNFLMAVFWPVGKSQSLVSMPGKGGAVTAVHSMMALVPVALFFGLLAEAITLTGAMLVFQVGAMAVMVALGWLMPGRDA